MVRNAKRSGRTYSTIMPAYRPIDPKFENVPSLPDLDIRTSEYVYFVESDSPFKLIKIGRTESLRRRLLGLQAGCPVQLKAIAVIRAPAGTETLFHWMFAKARAHGEWFLPTVELIEFAGQLPKMGALAHDEVRALCESKGCTPLQVTQAFSLSSKSKRRRPRIKFGRLVYT